MVSAVEHHGELSHVANNVLEMAGVVDADRDILAELQEGDRTTGALIEFAGYSRTHTVTRLQIMEARGWVQLIHEPTALWGLTEDAPDPDDLDV